MSEKRPHKTLADEEQRKSIVQELDRCMLVEAAAGTGKTAGIVRRMVALLARGRARIGTVAAVTFTRKAAAELRSRFIGELERAFREASDPGRGRLREALDEADSCFIGTIHSFCARLLRERPVEAGVPVDFREIDEDEDAVLRRRAWHEFVNGLWADDDPLLGRLREVGLHPEELAEAFEDFSLHADVPDWPAPPGPAPAVEAAADYLRREAARLEKLLPGLPEDPGNDELIPALRRLVRMVRQRDPCSARDVLEILEDLRPRKIVQSSWPDLKSRRSDMARAEAARWEALLEMAAPLVEAWRAHRYPPALEALRRAAERHRSLRREEGTLNYQDLLTMAADLLRSHPAVRAYFRRRFTHLLVDEFQDTDPVQAEVMLLLTAEDASRGDRRAGIPRPGSLFVVGDPKQSIYRFRRADIVTYNAVKETIRSGGGLVVELSTSFRSGPELISWINGHFGEVFPARATETSPGYVPLDPPPAAGNPEGRKVPAIGNDGDGPVMALRIPAEECRKERNVPFEADLIAGRIAAAIEGGSVPADFLVITRNTESLSRYGEKLEDRGIPHEVTGGAALNRSPELALLHGCLRACLRPDDPVALVSVLRGELFGLGDDDLWRFKRAGGEFSFQSPVPPGLEEGTASLFRDAWERLGLYHRWLMRLPPVAGMERIADHLGLFARAAASPGGNMMAGSLAKGLELLRGVQADFWTAESLTDYLGEILSGELKHDGLPARPRREAGVRVMNLHKAKGLQAPVVFLADANGEMEHPVRVHIDRRGLRPAGYLAIHAPGPQSGFAAPRILAHPPGWKEEWEPRERSFQKEEKNRLLYVAATRAGEKMIIVQRDRDNRLNPWSAFAKSLEGKSSLSPLGRPAAALSPDLPEAPIDPVSASAAIAGRWEAASRPGWEVRAAKELALAAAAAGPPAGGGEHGTEWGTVIHRLLEAAAGGKEAALGPLAEAFLEEQSLDPGLAAAAENLVRRVMESPLWRRAGAASQRLAEVPFQIQLPAGTPPAGELPLLLRGVIDLAFREKDGWVIVDYKTDEPTEGALRETVDFYRPQVRLYAEMWSRIAGEPVKEACLFFIHAGKVVPV